MAYSEETGVNSQQQKIYAIKELNQAELMMIKFGLNMLEESLNKSEDIERQKLLPSVIKLNQSIKQ